MVPKSYLEHRWNQGKKHPARGAHRHHGWNAERRARLMEEQRRPAAEDPAHHVLALGTDVPVVRKVAERQTYADHHQRGRLDDQLLQRPGIDQRRDEIGVHRLERILAQGKEQHGAGREGQTDGEQRRQDGHRQRWLGAALQNDTQHLSALPHPPARHRPSAGRGARRTSRLSDGMRIFCHHGSPRSGRRSGRSRRDPG